MPGKIVPIKNREVIPALEELLEDARAGKIVSIGYAVVEADDVTMEGIAGLTDESAVQLYGAINILRDMFFHMYIDHYSNGDLGDG